MSTFIRTDSNNISFRELVMFLDAELAERDGLEHAFYAQYNKINLIKNAVVFFENDRAIACGAIKEYDSSSMEVKRMFTRMEWRGRGIAPKILQELETWTIELGYTRCILETGKKQPEAINLYIKAGYIQIPNYGQYAGIENSICFEKSFSR